MEPYGTLILVGDCLGFSREPEDQTGNQLNPEASGLAAPGDTAALFCDWIRSCETVSGCSARRARSREL